MAMAFPLSSPRRTSRPDTTGTRGGRRPRPAGIDRRRATRRLLCETLEDRRLLAGWTYPGDGWALADGGVRDGDSGLVWSVDFGFTDDGGIISYDWNSANTGAENLVEGGFGDWRLPTKTELEEAMGHGLANHWGVLGQPYSLWTSTKGKGGYWRVNEDGTSETSSATNSYIPVIAVRGTRAPADYQIPGVRVFSTELITSEYGERQWFTVALDTQPTANVTMAISSSDVSEGIVDKSSLTFTSANWNVPQYVKVSSVDDFQDDGDVTYRVIVGPAVSVDVNYDNLDPYDVQVINLDNDEAVLQITATTLATSESGGSETFSVVLKAQPESSVFVVLESSNTLEGIVEQPLLTFTAANWNVPQMVTVTGVDDAIIDGEQTYEIIARIRDGSSPEFLPAEPIRVSAFNADNDRIYASGTLNLSIPDPGTVRSTIDVTDGYLIADVNVELNINHTFDADLDVYLIGPDGTRVELFTDIGIGNDNFTGTILNDEASKKINGRPAPYTGTFRPEGSLSAFDGKNVTGKWTLEVTDDTRKDRGTLLNWALNISATPPVLPLLAEAAHVENGASVLSLADVTPILAEAAERWQLAGVTATPLRDIQVQIADLGGRTLGLASGNTIWLDDDAAGWGWFVDQTPHDDSEFTLVGDQGEQDRMDLLTVVMHELGHLFGYAHDEHGLMAETLAAGVRRTDLGHDHAVPVDDLFHATGSAPAGGWLGLWLIEELESQRPWAKRRK